MLLEASGGFWRLEAPGSFWRLLGASGCFWRLLQASGGFWMLLEASGCFWKLNALLATQVFREQVQGARSSSARNAGAAASSE